MGPVCFFTVNPNLAAIFGDTVSDFENLCSWIVGYHISGFPGPQIPRLPDADGVAGEGQTLGAQPDPYPNARRDQMSLREPLQPTDTSECMRVCKRYRFPVAGRCVDSIHPSCPSKGEHIVCTLLGMHRENVPPNPQSAFAEGRKSFFGRRKK